MKIVVLATADFDSPVLTNKQHLAAGLAAEHDVVYLESLGLRRPTLAPADLRRMAGRLRRAAAPGRGPTPATGPAPAPGRARPARLRVVSPTVVPLHASRLARAVNARQIGRLADRLQIGPDTVLWTFSPLTYGLAGRAGATVYHSVDLLHIEPRLPAATLLAAERQLLATADAVIASSSGIEAHLRAAGRADVRRWENVADVERFAAAPKARRDRVVFAGHLTPAKVDLGLLSALVDRGIELALAGPVALDGTGSFPGLTELLRRPGVQHLGNLSLDELAVELGRSKVGLIPYVCDDHSAGIFPMKVYEYLAAGLPVVSTPLASLTGRDIPGLTVAAGAAFADRVGQALAGFDEGAAAARAAGAMAHSWTGRVRQAVDLVDELAARHPGVAARRPAPAGTPC